jgi:tetratricopeptide (TPR) repeat protein
MAWMPAKKIVTLLSNRWQIPLAICAVGAATIVMVRLRPQHASVRFDSSMTDLRALADAGDLIEAIDAAATLLSFEPPLPDEQQAELHDFLSESLFDLECRRSAPLKSNAQLIVEHGEQAEELGWPVNVQRSFRMGQAYEWLGERLRAVEQYRRVIQSGGAAARDEIRASNQALVRLLEGIPEDEAERRRAMLALLADEGVSPGYVWWALQRSITEALDKSDTIAARRLLEDYGGRLSSSELRGYYEYLSAWISLAEGKVGEAEPVVDWVEEWLGERKGDDDLSEFGYLPAMNRWLLGRIHLAQNQPEAALEAFDKADALRPASWVDLASVIGRADALSRLGRHDEALSAYRVAVYKLLHPSVFIEVNGATAEQAAVPSDVTERLPSGVCKRLRESLLALSRAQEAHENYTDAADYLALALDLTPAKQEDTRMEMLEHFADLHIRVAEDSSDPLIRSANHLEAARLMERAALLAILDAGRMGDLMWGAAEQYDAAGRIGAARRVLSEFVQLRTSDVRYPKALLKLGNAYEAAGDWNEAINWYAKLSHDYPGLVESAKARLHTASCLISADESRHPEAERILAELLEDDLIAPESDVYCDALHILCDLLYYHNRNTEAIGRLSDLLAYYPNDERGPRSRFMLADSYRKAALELRDSPPVDADPQRVANQGTAWLRTAIDTFAALEREVDERGGTDPALATYARLAALHRGDCLLILNDPDSIQQALALFGRIAARYECEPAALTAQVRIATIYLRSGQRAEAARALERARWLLGQIPDEAFVEYGDGTDRAYWTRYIDTMLASELFRDFFASAQ